METIQLEHFSLKNPQSKQELWRASVCSRRTSDFNAGATEMLVSVFRLDVASHNTHYRCWLNPRIFLVFHIVRPWSRLLSPYVCWPFFSQASVFGFSPSLGWAESDVEVVGQLEWLRRRRRQWDGNFIWKDLDIIPWSYQRVFDGMASPWLPSGLLLQHMRPFVQRWLWKRWTAVSCSVFIFKECTLVGYAVPALRMMLSSASSHADLFVTLKGDASDNAVKQRSSILDLSH